MLEAWRPGEFATIDEMLVWLGSLPGLPQVEGNGMAISTDEKTPYQMFNLSAGFRNDVAGDRARAESALATRFAEEVWGYLAENAIPSDQHSWKIEWREHVEVDEFNRWYIRRFSPDAPDKDFHTGLRCEHAMEFTRLRIYARFAAVKVAIDPFEIPARLKRA